ncbi:helix-turn-helix domain-containing protein [Bacillus infantis]|uniref:TrmB family transcriptional regulator n=1 Tax=Bacillus infantis TaxID=324767 RepID=UPI00344DE4E1
MNIKKVVATLKSFDFTEYEAKVYISLLEENPSNGNGIALRSGVPGPKVYETLRKMMEKGYVFEVSEGEKQGKKRYSPLPYKDLLYSLQNTLTNHIDILNNSFENLQNKSNNNWTELFHISGYETSLEVLKEGIIEAEFEIVLSCWSVELEKIYNELMNAHKRNVHVVTIIFDGGSNHLPWKTFKHYQFSTTKERHNGELSCVIDMNKVIVLDSLEEQPHAVVSSHQAMIKTTRNYIRHDIYVNRIMQEFSEEMKQKFGPNLENLVGDF